MFRTHILIVNDTSLTRAQAPQPSWIWTYTIPCFGSSAQLQLSRRLSRPRWLAGHGHMVTHPSMNWAQFRKTTLIETNTLPRMGWLVMLCCTCSDYGGTWL